MKQKPLNEIERNRARLRLRIYEMLMGAYILIWIWLALDILWIKWFSLTTEMVIALILVAVQIPTTIRLNKLAQDIDRSDRYFKIRKKWFK